jgi:hypothetical protein
MPAGAKMSIASMKAEPMMPKMSVTPLATMVSTKASEGVIFCTPVTASREALTGAAGCFWLMDGVSCGMWMSGERVGSRCKKSELLVPKFISAEYRTASASRQTIYKKLYALSLFL